MNRIDRLSAILIMLQSSSTVKPKQITTRFNIGIRTVYRDVRALEEAGIPITGDSKIGYSLVDGFKLPPLMFTQQEAFAFVAAERLVNKFTDVGFRENYKSGINKIRVVMRLADVNVIETIDNKIGTLDFGNTYSLPIETESNLQVLMDSIVKRKKLELNYQSHNEKDGLIRIIDPIGIFFSMANWYLVAFCNMREDYRTFRIRRIKNINQTDLSFNMEHPPLDSFLESLSRRENLQEIIIEVNKCNFQIIDQQKYYQGLIDEKQIDDLVQLRFMVFSLERFARWYLSYIDIGRIVSPQSLKSIIKSILNKCQEI